EVVGARRGAFALHAAERGHADGVEPRREELHEARGGEVGERLEEFAAHGVALATRDARGLALEADRVARELPVDERDGVAVDAEARASAARGAARDVGADGGGDGGREG